MCVTSRAAPPRRPDARGARKGAKRGGERKKTDALLNTPPPPHTPPRPPPSTTGALRRLPAQPLPVVRDLPRVPEARGAAAVDAQRGPHRCGAASFVCLLGSGLLGSPRARLAPHTSCRRRLGLGGRALTSRPATTQPYQQQRPQQLKNNTNDDANNRLPHLRLRAPLPLVLLAHARPRAPHGARLDLGRVLRPQRGRQDHADGCAI